MENSIDKQEIQKNDLDSECEYMQSHINYLEKENNDLQSKIDKAIGFALDYKDVWIKDDEVLKDMDKLLDLLRGE